MTITNRRGEEAMSETRTGLPSVEDRCGYEVRDLAGNADPCNRPATGWRWYQDCGHEDLLDVACDVHENEGGNRMHAAEARVLELAAAVPRIKAEALREAADAVEARQIICPVHHMGDCSPLLNGCSIPIHLHEQRQIDLRLISASLNPTQE